MITCFIDYDDGPDGSLKFSANGEEPIDSGVKLPKNGLRPWLFLYHEGDSVTVEVCRASAIRREKARRGASARRAPAAAPPRPNGALPMLMRLSDDRA